MSGTGTRRSFMGAKAIMRFRSALYGMLLGFLIPVMAVGPVLAQTATLLPDAKQQYLDDAGNPVALGRVDYYIPSTTTRKTVWQDANKTTPQTNGVVLDAAGRPMPTGQTYGDGQYRQVVRDVNNLTVWDAVTSSTGNGGGTAPAFSEGVMVGAIIPWANMVLPGKYLYTAGQAVLRSSYPDLLTALTFSTTILCQLGVGTITVSTDISDRVPIGTPIEVSCFAPGTIVSSKASGSLTMSSNATATTSVVGKLFPWGNGNGSTTFNVPNISGRTLVGRDNMNGVVAGILTSTYYTTPGGTGVNPDAMNAPAGSQNRAVAMANLPATPAPVAAVTGAYNPVATRAGNPAFGVSSTSPGQTYGTPGGATGYETVQFGTIAINGFSSLAVSANTANLGSGTPVSMVQPSVTADYIIKALPDDTPGGPGVSSIQGMTGAINCAGGITCTAQTIRLGTGGANTFALFSDGAGSALFRAITGADLPNPSTVSLGGIFAKPQVAGQVIGGIDTSGNPQLVTSGTFPSADVFGLAAGRLGATNPAFQVDSSTALQDTGVKITGQAGVNGVNIDAIGANADVPLIFNAKGTGTINFGTNSTGSIVFFRNAIGTGTATVNGAMAANTVKCNNTGSVATSIDCTKVPNNIGGTNVTASTDVSATFIPRTLSVQNSGDTNDCSSGSGSFRAYNLTYSIPASFMVNNRAIRIIAHYRVTTGTVPTGLEFQLKLGGTVVAHYGPNTPAVSVTNIQLVNQWLTQATAAPGATTAVETAMMSNLNGIGSITVSSDTAQPVNLATNGALALTIESKWAGACTGTNQIKLSQLVVEALN